MVSKGMSVKSSQSLRILGSDSALGFLDPPPDPERAPITSPGVSEVPGFDPGSTLELLLCRTGRASEAREEEGEERTEEDGVVPSSGTRWFSIPLKMSCMRLSKLWRVSSPCTVQSLKP